MFHQVLTDLETSVREECDEKTSKKQRLMHQTYAVAGSRVGEGGGGGGGECSHESNCSSYRPFSETPDIFKALPTSNFYYSYQPSDQSIKSIGVLQFNMQAGLEINPLTLDQGAVRRPSDLPSASSTAASVTTTHLSRLSTLTLCPQNMSHLTPSPSFFPTDLPPFPHAPDLSPFDVSSDSPFDPPDARLAHTGDDEMWNQFQGSVASSLRQKYLTTTTERNESERERRGWNKQRLSLLISGLIPWRQRVFASVYAQPLSSSEFESSVTDPTILAKRPSSSSSSSHTKGTDSCICCSTALVTVFLVILLLLASLTFGKILRLDNLWKMDPDDGSTHFADLKERWWQEGIFYEIFPPSFRDSDSDGFGDLNGIRDKISYIKDLGVTGIRLNSFFTAMDYPHQYDHVTDFKSVDPHVGSLTDFQNLVHTLHQHRLTVIIDINPSVTSDQHQWATQWLSNKSSAYSSFYVINSESERPLDLTSTTATDLGSKELQEIHLSFGGHLLLNWSCPAVRERMLDAFRFWLRLGVDGFYLRNVHNMQFESPEDVFEVLNELHEVMRDEEERIKGQDAGPGSQRTRERDESQDTDASKKRHLGPNPLPEKRILIASRTSVQLLASRVGKTKEKDYFSPLTSNFRRPASDKSIRNPTLDERRAATLAPGRSDAQIGGQSDRLDRPDLFSYFHLIDTFLDIRANQTENIRDQVNEVFFNQPDSHPWILWNIGSATSSRLASRLGSEFSTVASFLLTMLPGSISLFYGDEIGLKDSHDSLSKREYRGGQLTPMLWTGTGRNATFSRSGESISWMPVNSNQLRNNVQRQSEVILRLQQLTTFRRNNFVLDPEAKAGNYLFHYVHEGEIVLERYFTRVNELDVLNAMKLMMGKEGSVRDRRSVRTYWRRQRWRRRRERRAGDEESGPQLIRYRFVLFANLAATARVRDFRDKFHFGSIKVTSVPKRIRDFLYFRSLKLDPGEAIIAQVE